MRQFVLRWTFWGALLLFACLTTGGAWRFLSPPASKVPLGSLARMPPRIEEISESDPLLLASRGEPLRLPGPISYQEKTVGRRGYAVAVAGSLTDFPVQSVTFFPEIQVFLVSTPAGFGAFYGRESWYDRALHWDTEGRFFLSSNEASGFTLLGRCFFGPGAEYLSRYAVRVDGDLVLIDLGTRFVDPGLR